MRASIGIIGGADGPTAIFVTGPQISPAVIVFAAVIVISVIGLIIVKHRHK